MVIKIIEKIEKALENLEKDFQNPNITTKKKLGLVGRKEAYSDILQDLTNYQYNSQVEIQKIKKVNQNLLEKSLNKYIKEFNKGLIEGNKEILDIIEMEEKL